MNILVTGAAGFVGPYLIHELRKRYPSAVIYATYHDHKLLSLLENGPFSTIFMDLRFESNINAIISNTKPELIFHLAAQSSVSYSWKDPNTTYEVNLLGTLNLLKSLLAYSPTSRMLVIGSSEQYGIVNKTVDETMPFAPMNIYAASKVAQEEVCRIYQKVHGLNIIFTRSFNHTGPKQEPAFVIPDWCQQIARIEKGLQENVISVGNLNVERDFSHVEDVVQSYIDILLNGEIGQAYNVGSGVAVSLNKILEYLLKISTVDIRIEHDTSRMRPSDNPRIVTSDNKLKSVTNIRFREIESILDDVLEYWRKKVETDLDEKM